MQSYTKIPLTAAILAGGKSSRMKTQKCLLNIDNRKIIDFLIQKLERLFEEIFIVTNFPELYFYTGVALLGDIYPFKGPISGIHVAVKNSQRDVFAFACDMPFVKEEVIYAIAEQHIKKSNISTVPSHTGRVYPFPGIYSKALFNKLEELLIEEKLSIRKFLDEIHPEVVEVANFDKEGLSFININTEEDLEYLRKGGIRCLDLELKNYF